MQIVQGCTHQLGRERPDVPPPQSGRVWRYCFVCCRLYFRTFFHAWRMISQREAPPPTGGRVGGSCFVRCLPSFRSADRRASMFAHVSRRMCRRGGAACSPRGNAASEQAKRAQRAGAGVAGACPPRGCSATAAQRGGARGGGAPLLLDLMHIIPSYCSSFVISKKRFYVYIYRVFQLPIKVLFCV